MNIFFLDENPAIAASMQCDKHVVKMVSETGQLLSTAFHLSDSNNTVDKTAIMASTHANHPSAKWVRESVENYKWTVDHFLALCKVYTNRYNKIHAIETQLSEIVSNSVPSDIPQIGLTAFPNVTTDNIREMQTDTIEAYKRYYSMYKSYMADWRYSDLPDWYTQYFRKHADFKHVINFIVDKQFNAWHNKFIKRGTHAANIKTINDIRMQDWLYNYILDNNRLQEYQDIFTENKAKFITKQE